MKPCFSRVPLVCLVNCAVHSISCCYIHECNLKPVSFQIVLPLCPLFLYLQFHLFLFDTSFRFPSFLFSFSWIFVARGSSSGDYTTWTLWSCLRSRPSLGHFGEGKNVSSPVLNLTLPIRLLCLERPLPGGWSAVSSCKRKKNTRLLLNCFTAAFFIQFSFSFHAYFNSLDWGLATSVLLLLCFLCR